MPNSIQQEESKRLRPNSGIRSDYLNADRTVSLCGSCVENASRQKLRNKKNLFKGKSKHGRREKGMFEVLLAQMRDRSVLISGSH